MGESYAHEAARQSRLATSLDMTLIEHKLLYSQPKETKLPPTEKSYFKKLLATCRKIYEQAKLAYAEHDLCYQVNLTNSEPRLKPLMFAVYMRAFIEEDQARIKISKFFKPIYDKQDVKESRYTELAASLDNYIYRYSDMYIPEQYEEAMNEIFHALQEAVLLNRRSKSEKKGKGPESAEKFQWLKLALTAYEIGFPPKKVPESVVVVADGCSYHIAGPGSAR